jgi:hypothetical protein
VFTNSAGTTTTNVATLTVTVPPLTTSMGSLVGASGTSQALYATASGPAGIASVEFEITGGSPTPQVVATATHTTSDNWVAQWNTTTVPNGNWQIQSVATDADGNTALSAPLTVDVSNIWAIVLPADNATISGTANLDATAPSGPTKVVYEVSGGPPDLNNVPVATATLTPYGWLAQWDTTTVPNGTYNMQSIAFYPDGLSGTDGVTVNPLTWVVVDNAPPTTSVVLPSNDASVSGSQNLEATASPGVTQVAYELSGGPSNLNDRVIATGTPTANGWLAVWHTKGVANGTYTLQSVASYAGGVTGTSAPVTITVTN